MILPSVQESELRHLMQYLFAAPGTDYGTLRAEQGTSARWSDYFEQIFFEMSGENGLPSNDLEKSAFVDYCLDIISSCPEYKSLKQKIVFVDGMSYKDGISRSHADYHASDLIKAGQLQDRAELERSEETLLGQLPRDPSRVLYGRGEILRNIQSDAESLRAADILAHSLQPLGDELSLCLLGYPELAAQLPEPLWLLYFHLGRQLAGAERLDLQANVPDGDAQRLVGYAFALADGRRLVIWLNLADSPLTASLNLDEAEGVINSYDARGEKLSESEQGRRQVQTTVWPGGVTVLELPIP